jgi:non-lysosomal glucosylceramidase
MYLASLRAAEGAANAIGDTTWAAACRTQFGRSQKDVMRLLWNGQFFSYGCQVDGTGRLDDTLFTGQLAGEFISRYCGWGDVFSMPVIQSALKAQFDISLSHTPDYYANKVWDIRQGKGIDQRGSQCWPFYLESYTAYTAIQAGSVADGLDIMRHIQLVHLRKGLTWSQNLWNPGDITYMTGPVTWFSTDVLAGAGVNVPKGELRLAPCMGDTMTSYPLYFPTFWAMVKVDPGHRKIWVDITKTFGKDTIILKKLIVEPAGLPADERKTIPLPPFSIKTGRRLDLSGYYDVIMPEGAAKDKRLLPPID